MRVRELSVVPLPSLKERKREALRVSCLRSRELLGGCPYIKLEKKTSARGNTQDLPPSGPERREAGRAYSATCLCSRPCGRAVRTDVAQPPLDIPPIALDPPVKAHSRAPRIVTIWVVDPHISGARQLSSAAEMRSETLLGTWA